MMPMADTSPDLTGSRPPPWGPPASPVDKAALLFHFSQAACERLDGDRLYPVNQNDLLR